MRGFAITMDAVVALSFVVFAMIIIASQAYSPRAPEAVYLKQLTLDVLSVSEKTGAFDRALGGDPSSLQEILESTPYLACMDIAILDGDGEIIAGAAKAGCNETSGQDVQTLIRPLMHQGRMYIAKTGSWFHKEPG
ncbi:MAG: hypothetical protein V1827_01365 [Candidatus Micrarchaeota archaeon]